MRYKASSRKHSLKFSIQKMQIIASHPVASWQIDGENVKTVSGFIFLDSRITGDCVCNHQIKRCWLLGRKAMTKRQCIKKQRHYFTNKSPYNQSYGFSSSHVQMWELDHKESWTRKNWCFRTVLLERTLEFCGQQRKSNQSILEEINPEYLLEGLSWSWSSNILATWCEELIH